MTTDALTQVPTLQDVARRAGVSTATVSRCLNNPEVLRSETRGRVEEAIAELGYTPHFGARALASNRTWTVGVIIPTMENAIFAHGLQAMEETLSEQGVTMLVATSGYDPERELEKIRALLARGVDGLGLIGFERSDAAYQLMSARSVPFVVIWNYDAVLPYPCVGFDNRAAAAAMTERVLSFGHRRIAMISGLTGINDRARARLNGVRDALATHGLALPPEKLIESVYSFAGGEEAASRLLAAPDPPTAIICGNDVLAVGALRAARRAGLHVPEDISIIGFDDIDLASTTEPPLTTVRAPHQRMGRAAAEMLLALPEDGESGTHIRFETEVIERGSLGPAAEQ